VASAASQAVSGKVCSSLPKRSRSIKKLKRDDHSHRALEQRRETPYAALDLVLVHQRVAQAQGVAAPSVMEERRTGNECDARLRDCALQQLRRVDPLGQG